MTQFTNWLSPKDNWLGWILLFIGVKGVGEKYILQLSTAFFVGIFETHLSFFLPLYTSTTLLVTNLFHFLSSLYFFTLTSLFTFLLPVLNTASLWFPHPPLHRSPSHLCPVSDSRASLHGNRVMFRDGGGWNGVNQLNPHRFPE